MFWTLQKPPRIQRKVKLLKWELTLSYYQRILDFVFKGDQPVPFLQTECKFILKLESSIYMSYVNCVEIIFWVLEKLRFSCTKILLYSSYLMVILSFFFSGYLYWRDFDWWWLGYLLWLIAAMCQKPEGLHWHPEELFDIPASPCEENFRIFLP